MPILAEVSSWCLLASDMTEKAEEARQQAHSPARPVSKSRGRFPDSRHPPDNVKAHRPGVGTPKGDILTGQGEVDDAN